MERPVTSQGQWQKDACSVLRSKEKVYKTMIWPVIIYGAKQKHGHWGRKKKELESTEMIMRMLRWILGISLKGHKRKRTFAVQSVYCSKPYGQGSRGQAAMVWPHEKEGGAHFHQTHHGSWSTRTPQSRTPAEEMDRRCERRSQGTQTCWRWRRRPTSMQKENPCEWPLIGWTNISLEEERERHHRPPLLEQWRYFCIMQARGNCKLWQWTSRKKIKWSG